MTLDSYHRSRLEALEALEKAATRDWAAQLRHETSLTVRYPVSGGGTEAFHTRMARAEDAMLAAEARNLLPALIEVAKAAQRYREIGLSDPTSLDLPPAGAALDRALALLDEGDAR